MSKALDSINYLRHRKSAGRAGASSAVNTAAIQAAIDELYAAGGGVVDLPPGTLNIAVSTLADTFDNEGVPVAATSGCLVLRSGVYLKGRGRGVTKLVVDSNGTLSGILVVSPLFGGISDLTLNASWNGVNGAGHGIIQYQQTGEEYCENFHIERCEILNCASYGIGIENGDIENLWIKDNYIFNTGADGIDIKGRGASGGYQPGIVVRGNHIKQHGRRGALNDQAGIDVRGFALVEGNTVEIVEPAVDDSNTRVGIRARPAGTGETYGSRWTRVVNNFVISDQRRLTRGIVIGGAKVKAASNTLSGLTWGVRVLFDSAVATNGSHAHVNDNNVHDSQVAYATDAGVERAVFADNDAQDVTELYRLDGDNGNVTNARGTNCTTVFRMAGDNNKIDGGRIDGTVTTRINDTGSGNTVQNVHGVRTRSRTQSATFAIDSTGVRTITVAHSLNVTPGIADVVATVSETVTTDQRLGAIEVTAVDATNITLKVAVITASATGGATAKLNVDTNTERI